MIKIRINSNRAEAQFIKMLLAKFVGSKNFELEEKRSISTSGSEVELDVKVHANFSAFAKRVEAQKWQLQYIASPKKAGAWEYELNTQTA